MCGNKCKCVDCSNYAGSQRLIDKRRKMKDTKGAEFAMRMSDEAWKGKHVGQTPRARGMSSATITATSSAAITPGSASLASSASRTSSHVHRGHSIPLPPPASHMMHSPHHSHPSHHPHHHSQHPHHSHHHRGSRAYPHYYQAPPPPHSMGRQSRPGAPPTASSYSSGSSAYPPQYSHGKMQRPPPRSSPALPSTASRSQSSESSSGHQLKYGGENSRSGSTDGGRPSSYAPTSHHPNHHYLHQRSSSSVPSRSAGTHNVLPPTRSPAIRLGYDTPLSRKKKRRNTTLTQGGRATTGRSTTEVAAYFGQHLPSQTKATALSVLSFLSNDDLYNAGLVCKSWSKLSIDEELWEFP